MGWDDYTIPTYNTTYTNSTTDHYTYYIPGYYSSRFGGFNYYQDWNIGSIQAETEEQRMEREYNEQVDKLRGEPIRENVLDMCEECSRIAGGG